MDYTDEECQKWLIKTLLNSVFVYDDKVVLTFNCSGDDRTITLREIDGGYSRAFVCPAPCATTLERSHFDISRVFSCLQDAR